MDQLLTQRRRRGLATGAIVLAMGLGLSGCSASSYGGGGASPEIAVDGGVAPQDARGLDTGSIDSPGVDRSVIVTGWATVLVEDPATAVTEAVRITSDAGGRVDSRTEQSPTDYSAGSATLVLRIPAARLDAALEELKRLGTVQEVSLGTTDVTLEVQDLDARISAMKSSIERLEALIASATSTADLIELETAVSDRQGQLESMEAQQRYLKDQVSMSTLTLNLVTEPVSTDPPPGDFWEGLVAGWDALVKFAAGFVVALGAFLPWLIPLGIVALIVWGIIRLARRRRSVKAAGQSATGPSEAPSAVPSTQGSEPSSELPPPPASTKL